MKNIIPTLSRQSSLPMDDTRINISIQHDPLNSHASISGVRSRLSLSVDSKFLELDVDTVVVVVPPTPPTREFVVVTSHKTQTALISSKEWLIGLVLNNYYH